MVRRLSCILLLVGLVSGFVIPCFASDNTVGEIYTEIDFVGFSYGESGYKYPQFFATDGFVNKYTTGTSFVTIKPVFNFFFEWPDNADELSAAISLTYACSYVGTVAIEWYGLRQNGWNNYEPTLLSTSWKDLNGVLKTNYTGFSFSSFPLTNDNYDLLLVKIIGPYDTCSLYTGVGDTVKLSSNMYFSLDEYTIKATIRTGANTSTPVYQLYDGYDTIYNYAPNVEFAELDGTIEYGTITGVGGTMSGSVTTDSATPYIASAEAFVLYGDDGGLVDEVFSIGDDVESIAGNMQTIVDDIQSQKNAAGDIGGATSAESIANTQETLSSGTAAAQEFSSVSNQGFSDMASNMGGMVSLMAVAAPALLNMGGDSYSSGPYMVKICIMISLSMLLFYFKVIRKGD